MVESQQLQQQLFAQLKNSLPPHLSLVDEISSLLDLSPDSVYRRIRGEKPLTLTELKKICVHFRLSLDQLLQLQSDTVVFSATDLHKQEFPFGDILSNMLRQLKYINGFKDRKMLYLCKDMPIWQFYLFPEIGAFKSYVWSKTILNEPGYDGTRFSLDEYRFDAYQALGAEIIREYNQLPSIELWNEESINSTLNQIRFYKDSGGFKNPRDIGRIIDSFEATIGHLRLQAEKGQKFMPGDADVSYRAPVQIYVNEIVIGSNTILAEGDNMKISFIPYNVFSFLHTRHSTFNERVFHGFDVLKSRSMLISGTGEKERNRFFNFLTAKVNELRH